MPDQRDGQQADQSYASNVDPVDPSLEQVDQANQEAVAEHQAQVDSAVQNDPDYQAQRGPQSE